MMFYLQLYGLVYITAIVLIFFGRVGVFLVSTGPNELRLPIAAAWWAGWGAVLGVALTRSGWL